MNLNTYSIYYCITFSVAFLLVGSHSAHVRNGKKLVSSVEAPKSFDEYQEMLVKKARKDGSTPLRDDERKLLSTTGARITAKFPDGTFDPGQVWNRKYMRGIPLRCANNINTNSKEEVLACHIYFSPNMNEVPMAMGPINMDVNLFDATNGGLYHSSQINNIFVDHAMAVMIEKGCFLFDSSENAQTETQMHYTDEESYKNNLKTDKGLQIGATGGYGPVQTSAGYNNQDNAVTSSGGKQKVAYGEHKFSAPIGSLVNTCLQSKKNFRSVILEHKLVKPDVLDMWNKMQNSSDPLELVTTEEFKQIARGGLLVPSVYHYGAAVKTAIHSIYKNSDHMSSTKMKSVINAGVGVKYKLLDTSVNTEVTNVVDEVAKEANITQSSFVTTEAFGNNIDTGCFKTKDDNTCPELLIREVNKIRENLNFIGRPYMHGALVSLDDIVTYYTGSRFGEVFDDALNNYFSYGTCDNPDESQNYSLFNGKGELIGRDDCPERKRCTSIFAYNDENNEPTVCEDDMKYQCIKSNNDVTKYVPEKNQWRSIDNKETGYCPSDFVCNSDEQEYDPEMLCAPTLRCSGDKDIVQAGDNKKVVSCGRIELCKPEFNDSMDISNFCAVDEGQKQKVLKAEMIECNICKNENGGRNCSNARWCDKCWSVGFKTCQFCNDGICLLV